MERAHERDEARPGGQPGADAASWRESATHLQDPRALRAYAHPTRMRLVGLLRTGGPCTATRAAEAIGESVASCSYHLRMLAKYGLVEQAEGGRGRQKPWRATARFTVWPEQAADPAVAEAATALTVSAVELWFQRVRHAVETRDQLPADWRAAESFGDTTVHLTPAELAAVRARFRAVLDEYADRDTDPARRPAGARPVSVVDVAHVLREVPGEPT